ncbi:MAG: hypothetical protein RL490_1873 [Pseudomonadota bacterium]
MAEARVFISMGTPYTETQSRFRDALETFLREKCKIDPRIIGKNEYPDGNPLTKIRTVMSQCHGVIVLAYERKYLESGFEKRSGKMPLTISNRSYTTPWNHIESAMAFTMGLPLYILCQTDLTEEGLIESKLDWYVQRIDIEPAEFNRIEISRSLESWIENRVIPLSKKPRMLKTVEGSLKFSEMTPKEIFGALAIIAGAFSLGVTAALMLPKVFG